MSDLPDGVDHLTMVAAIAWEMTKLSLQNKVDFKDASTDERLSILAKAFGFAYYAVLKPREIKDQN